MLRIILYLLIILGPLSVLVFTSETYYGFMSELGRSTALAGFMMLSLQPVLAGRFKWITRPFGFDMVIRYHRHMALLALFLIVLHPFLLAAGDSGFELLYSTDQAWYIVLGKITLLIFILSAISSLFGIPDWLGFERWRMVHDILFPIIMAGVFVHSWYAGDDLRIAWMRRLWFAAGGISIFAYLYHRFLRSLLLSRKPFRVINIRNPVDKVWDIEMAPPEGKRAFSYLPGQFQFITFHRQKGLPVEEHHWTISSSPTKWDLVSVTIKELGDFTSTIGKTRPGDTATVHAPFGRFSYILHPEEEDFVFISGGIGITPVMSMLRHMRDSGSKLPVLLIYANRNLESAVFREELDHMEKEQVPRLKIIDILSEPEEGWQGETGRIGSAKLRRYCEGVFDRRAFYLCGPVEMVESAVKNLEEFGVPDKRIHTEIFSFLD